MKLPKPYNDIDKQTLQALCIEAFGEKYLDRNTSDESNHVKYARRVMVKDEVLSADQLDKLYWVLEKNLAKKMSGRLITGAASTSDLFTDMRCLKELLPLVRATQRQAVVFDFVEDLDKIVSKYSKQKQDEVATQSLKNILAALPRLREDLLVKPNRVEYREQLALLMTFINSFLLVYNGALLKGSQNNTSEKINKELLALSISIAFTFGNERQPREIFFIKGWPRCAAMTGDSKNNVSD